MKKNHTDITIVLDRSGSMQTVAQDTIGGFNKFLQDQKTAEGTADITLHQFDDRFETAIATSDVKSAAELTSATFVPRGSTALLDAIGRAINDTGERMSKEPAEKVVFVIITDGMENASREFTKAKINEMITHQREKYSWEFVFLAANQDAIASGADLGVNMANSMSYAANAAGTTKSFEAVSRNLNFMRSGATCDMSFAQDQRDEQYAEGAVK